MKRKKIPSFKNEAEERKFWLEHDSTEYLDLSKAKFASFPNLEPSTKNISLRLPEMLLNNLKTLANKNDIAYQALIKIYLAEKVKENFEHDAGKKIMPHHHLMKKPRHRGDEKSL